MTEAIPELLTVKEAAARLKVQPKTIREWLQPGKVRGAKAGKSWRIPVDALTELVKPSLHIVPVSALAAALTPAKAPRKR